MLGVPDEAKGVVVNLTVTQASGYGYLTAFPCGGATPTTSNVNYNFGVDRANTAIMALGPQGSLCVQLSEADAHVIVDVNGWLGGDQGIQYGSATKRIADSRDGTGGWSGTFAPGQTRELIPGPDLPFGSRVAVLGITSTQSTGAGFIKVQPCGGQAEVSNLNFVRAVDITNLTVVPLPDDGRICVTASERTHIIVDVFGGFGVPGLARELAGRAVRGVPGVQCRPARLHRLLPESDRQPRDGARARHATHDRDDGRCRRNDPARHHGDDRRQRRDRHHDHADRWWCTRGVLDPVRAAGLPAHHDLRRRRRPTRLVRPRQQRRADQRPVRNDHGLGRRPRLVQARRGESRPARPQASRRRIAGVVPDVRTRVRVRSDQRLRELPARRHAGRSHPDRRRA